MKKLIQFLFIYRFHTFAAFAIGYYISHYYNEENEIEKLQSLNDFNKAILENF